MAHRNVRLKNRARLEFVGQMEDDWPQTEVSRQFRVSRTTVAKWIYRDREEDETGLEDRSSVPDDKSQTHAP